MAEKDVLKMQKIVKNNSSPGGFRLSDEAFLRLRELGHKTEPRDDPNDIPRDDPRLIQVIEELGERASGKYSVLKIVEIPDGVEWEIQENLGYEWVAEKHRIWE